MVLYKVHSEFEAEKYYSTICSKATLFQIIVYSLMIFPPFFIAYATNGKMVSHLERTTLNRTFDFQSYGSTQVLIESSLE